MRTLRSFTFRSLTFRCRCHHSWGHAIPPPQINSSGSLEDWQGLTNVAWGASVYYEATKRFDRTVRDPAGDMFYGGRPLMLGKFGVMDWRPGLDAHGAAESPAHHRYPVWYVTNVQRRSPLDVVASRLLGVL